MLLTHHPIMGCDVVSLNLSLPTSAPKELKGLALEYQGCASAGVGIKHTSVNRHHSHTLVGTAETGWLNEILRK